MSQYKDAAIGDTVYFWFAANLITGAAGDGATPLYAVRLAGAASTAAPKATGTPTLLTNAGYTDGLHEIALDTTGWAAGEYAVFCTLTISTVNPAGFCGSFTLRAAASSLYEQVGKVIVDTTEILTRVPDATPGQNGGLPTTNGTKLNQTVDLTSGQSIAASSVPAVTLANGAHGGAAATIVLQTPIEANVASETNHDFTALQKTSLNAATPASVQNIPATGSGFTALGDTRIANLDATVSSRMASATIPTANAIADQVWDEALSGHVAAGSTGKRLGDIVATGTGAITWTYTLTNSVTGLPIADADVWVTSDIAGTNVIASGKTNASGIVTFYLDASTVYVWRQKSGFDFTNPDVEIVA